MSSRRFVVCCDVRVKADGRSDDAVSQEIAAFFEKGKWVKL